MSSERPKGEMRWGTGPVWAVGAEQATDDTLIPEVLRLLQTRQQLASAVMQSGRSPDIEAQGFICIVSPEHADMVQGGGEGPDRAVVCRVDATGLYTLSRHVGSGHLQAQPDGGLVFAHSGHTAPVLAALPVPSVNPEHFIGHLSALYAGELAARAWLESKRHTTQSALQQATEAMAATLEQAAGMRGEVAALVQARATAWALRQELVRLPTAALPLLTVPKTGGKRHQRGHRVDEGRGTDRQRATNRERASEIMKRLKFHSEGSQRMTVRLIMVDSRAQGLTGKSTKHEKAAPLALQPTLWPTQVRDGSWMEALAGEVSSQFRGFRLRAWLAWLVTLAEAGNHGIPALDGGHAAARAHDLLAKGRSRLNGREISEAREVLAAMESGWLHVERDGDSGPELVPLVVTVAHEAEQTEDGSVQPGAPTRLVLNPLIQADYAAGRSVRMAKAVLGLPDEMLALGMAVAAHASLDGKRVPTVQLAKVLERYGLVEWMVGRVEHEGVPGAMRQLRDRISRLRHVDDGEGGIVDLVGGMSVEDHPKDWRKAKVRWGAPPLVLTVGRAPPALPAATEPPAVSETAPAS